MGSVLHGSARTTPRMARTRRSSSLVASSAPTAGATIHLGIEEGKVPVLRSRARQPGHTRNSRDRGRTGVLARPDLEEDLAGAGSFQPGKPALLLGIGRGDRHGGPRNRLAFVAGAQHRPAEIAGQRRAEDRRIAPAPSPAPPANSRPSGASGPAIGEGERRR